MTTKQKPTLSKPPTREQLEQAAKAAYEFRLAEMDFLIPYNDLMEQAFMFADEIKAAVEVISNDEALGNIVANAAVNRFMELNKEQFAELEKLKPASNK